MNLMRPGRRTPCGGITSTKKDTCGPFRIPGARSLRKHGVPVLKGIVATTPEEAKAAAEEIGGLTVIKAQVKTGGRGKAGGP